MLILDRLNDQMGSQDASDFPEFLPDGVLVCSAGLTCEGGCAWFCDGIRNGQCRDVVFGKQDLEAEEGVEGHEGYFPVCKEWG